MENRNLDIEKIVNYWITTSDRDFETMLHMYDTMDYHWALFIGHITIEKLLKAGVVRNTNDHAPFTHDLRRLAKLSQIHFEEKHIQWLDTITAFNLNVRYDSYKQEFYKKCTPEYTAKWIENIKQLHQWIKMKL